MIESLVLAVVVAVIVGLVLMLLGRILKSLQVPIAVTVGGFFEQFCWVIGVVAGLLYFFGGGHIGSFKL